MSSEIRMTDLTHNEIIVATNRGKRPDQFRKKGELKDCPFCPGNEHLTPPPEIYRLPYPGSNESWTLRVVPNKFPAFEVEGNNTKSTADRHLISTIHDAHGAHEVVIESPLHETDYSEFTPENFLDILTAINHRVIDLYRDQRIRYVQVFKNFGDDAGASLRHEHTQIIGLPQIPKKLRERLSIAEDYLIRKGKSIFESVIQRSTEDGLVFYETDSFICLVPYEAKFPCEIWILPKIQNANFSGSSCHFPDLARTLSIVYKKLKAAFGFLPPFNAFIEDASPKFWRDCDIFFSWRYRISPRVTKIAGFELATACYINPTPPEESARALREAKIP